MSRPTDWRHLDWLSLVLASWAAPIALVSLVSAHHYFWSLTFWALPIGLLGRRALEAAQPEADSGVDFSRRRRGLVWTTVYIVAAGLVLDFGLGRWVLQFDNETPGQYVYVFPWGGVPVEEVLFYLLAPLAIVLTYVWCDEYWIHAYNTRELQRRIGPDETLVRLYPSVLWSGVGVLVVGVGFRRPWVDGGWPVYFAFLVVTAFVPTALLYQAVSRFVNWPALGATTLYAVGTAILWEATLAVPRRWWGFHPDHTLGIHIRDWSRSDRWPFPLEEAAVWFCAPLACVLVYEYAKARAYRKAARMRAGR